MMSLEDKVRGIVGKCPMCESDPVNHYGEKVMLDIVDNDERLQRIDPKLRATLLRLEIWCDVCIREHQSASAEHQRAKRIAVLRRNTYHNGLIPLSAKQMSFGNSLDAYEALNAGIWASFKNMQRLDKNYWLYGAPGTCKTYLARCLLNKALGNYQSAAEISSLKIYSIGNSFNPAKEMEPFKSVSVLLIEDFDKMTFTTDRKDEHGVTALWSLIDHRATENKRTIITSNQLPSQISHRMRTAVADNTTVVTSMFERLLPIEQIEMSGPSVRREEPRDVKEDEEGK